MFCFFSLDAEQYYNRIHLFFLEQNQEVKSFDLYRPSWEFLKESPKFATIMLTNSMAKQVSELKTGDDEEDLRPVSVVQDTPRPIGCKKAKRLQEEEKIMENVAEKMKGMVGAAQTGTALATALSKFADIFSDGLKEWKDQQMLANAAPELHQRYENLRLLSHIEELEARLPIQHCNNNGYAITTPSATEFSVRKDNDVHEAGVALTYLNNDDDVVVTTV